MIRVILPAPLKVLANVNGELEVDPGEGATISAVIAAIEARFPALRGTILSHGERKRRPMVRFYACNSDLSHADIESPLPDAVVEGREPLLIIGAIAGG
uniref:MoaD/ThiS family protein n=1 Tax=mine drainage metagenome TaxID=410659 RepID=E6Q7V6_9ZZZZ